MSTKIYNGFEWWGADMHTMQTQVEALRKKLDELTRLRLTEALAAFCVLVKKGKIKGDKKHPLPGALGALTDELVKTAEAQERRTFDFTCELVALPVDTGDRGKRVLGLYYTARNDVECLVRRQRWFKGYGYWNNTDKPDRVSVREWERRKRHWELALGDDTPAEHGLTLQVHRKHWFFPRYNLNRTVLLLQKSWPGVTLEDLVGGKDKLYWYRNAEQTGILGLLR